jgi:hypothetical protein
MLPIAGLIPAASPSGPPSAKPSQTLHQAIDSDRISQSTFDARRSMASRTLSVTNFAHIEGVSVRFGDLTILVGPQASGKSVVLQLFKLALDRVSIKKSFENYGMLIKGSSFLARYLGQGMENSLRPDSRIAWDGREIGLSGMTGGPMRAKPCVYYVPAHRTLALSEGYPPAFQQLKPETPFVVRQFSEDLRQILIQGIGRELLFPQAKRLKGKVREKINEAIFHGAELREDASGIPSLKLVQTLRWPSCGVRTRRSGRSRGSTQGTNCESGENRVQYQSRCV